MITKTVLGTQVSPQSLVLGPRLRMFFEKHFAVSRVPFTLGADLPPAGRGEPGAVFEGERRVLATSPLGCPKTTGGFVAPAFWNALGVNTCLGAMMAHSCQGLTV